MPNEMTPVESEKARGCLCSSPYKNVVIIYSRCPVHSISERTKEDKDANSER